MWVFSIDSIQMILALGKEGNMCITLLLWSSYMMIPKFACLPIGTTCCKFTYYSSVHAWCALVAEKKLHSDFSENKAQIFTLFGSCQHLQTIGRREDLPRAKRSRTRQSVVRKVQTNIICQCWIAWETETFDLNLLLLLLFRRSSIVSST
jgi:hypothetical protein